MNKLSFYHKYHKYRIKYSRLYSRQSFGINITNNDNVLNNNVQSKLITKLSKEYARYLSVQKMLKLERHPKYATALEKFLISISINNSDKLDQVFFKIDKKSIILYILTKNTTKA